MACNYPSEEPEIIKRLRGEIKDLAEAVRLDTIEECARECDEWAEAEQKVGAHKERITGYRSAAAAIRALKERSHE